MAARCCFEHPHTAWEPANPLVQELCKEGTEYVYTLPDQTKLDFNSGGQLTSETDRDGNALTMKYMSGRLESVTDSAGRELTLAYNSEGLVEIARVPMDQVDRIQLRDSLDQKERDFRLGESALRWQFKYNAEHELTSRRMAAATRSLPNTALVGCPPRPTPSGTPENGEYSGTFGRESTVTTITEPNSSVTREEFSAAGADGCYTRVRHLARGDDDVRI